MFEKILKKFHSLNRPSPKPVLEPLPEYEYCPRCDANLTLQKGYDNALPYWICKGCGEMLINPLVDAEDDIVWICDGCGAMLNLQEGFSGASGAFVCTVCGFTNQIDSSELYASEEDYENEMRNPYRGLSDLEVLSLARYQDLRPLEEGSRVWLARDQESGRLYVRKFLTIYDKSIYEFIKDHPIAHMPKIRALYESRTCLIVVEEYIEGQTLEERLKKGPFPKEEAISIALALLEILDTLHSLPSPIIHRDIKPSNIILSPEGKIYLLDMNAAKWYHEGKAEDTRSMGTINYAAPEQAGFGLTASTARSDIYALGVLLNVMVTGAFPKEKRPEGSLGAVIERCIRLEEKDRYTAKELTRALLCEAGRKDES